MLADGIKDLRQALACSVGELAEAVGVPVKTVLAWEAGEEFPTKRHADRLTALREKGAAAFPRKKKAPAGSEAELLAEPRFWTVFRKLLAHPALFSEVERLSEAYEDPALKR